MDILPIGYISIFFAHCFVKNVYETVTKEGEKDTNICP